MTDRILPARPLRLRWSFTASALARALVALAPALAVITAAVVWQAKAAYEVLDDRRGWERGADVELLSVSHEERVVFGLVHDVVVRARYLDPDGVERGGAMRWLSLFDHGMEGRARGRLDPVRDRLVVSWAAGAAPWRGGWLAMAALILAGLLGACVLAARVLLREYLVARRAARDSDEVELEVLELVTHDVHGKPSVLEVRYRVPCTAPASIGYRDSARAQRERDPPEVRRALFARSARRLARAGMISASAASDEVRTQRFRLAEGGPILLDESARVLALQPRSGAGATLVREDLWPFAVASADALRARERVASRDQPPSAPASISEIGTQAPESSNT